MLPERPFLDVRLEWSRNQPVDSTGGRAQTSERRWSWDDVVGDSPPIIAADRAFATDGSYSLFSSDDHGGSWSELDTLASGPGRAFCSAQTATAFAYMADNRAMHSPLTIVSADTTQQIDWPVRPRVFMGDQGFRPCGPMWMDGRWWLAEIDDDLRMLTITATADGERFDTYAVDLTGRWQDALPGGSGLGTANLFHDDDLIVLRLCRSGDGFPCAQSVDLELDASLLGDPPRPADAGGGQKRACRPWMTRQPK